VSSAIIPTPKDVETQCWSWSLSGQIPGRWAHYSKSLTTTDWQTADADEQQRRLLTDTVQ